MFRSSEPPRGTRKRVSALIVALLLGLAGALVPVASASAAILTVRVYDQHLQPVVDLIVDIEDDLGNVVSMTTDGSGELTLIDPSGADYTLTPSGGADADGRFYAQNPVSFPSMGTSSTVEIERLGQVSGHLEDQYGNDVVGLEFEVYDGLGATYVVESDPTDGTFSVPVTASTQQVSYVVSYGEVDDLGYGYVAASDGGYLDPTTEAHDFGTIVLDRYENVAGTITGFDVTTWHEVGIQVSYRPDSVSTWSYFTYVTTTDGAFSIPAILELGEYSLYFEIDPTSRVPYLDAFLGGEFEDAALSDLIIIDEPLDIVPTIVTATLPDAALITGRVSTGGSTALTGIYVIGYQESGAASHADLAETDSNGDYTLRARPGETYAVLAVDPTLGPDPYATMVYDGFYGCSCQFTPVISELATPAEHIDFDMTRESELFFILGELYETDVYTGHEFDHVRIHVQRLVSGVWTDVAITESDSNGEFEVVVPRDDIAYRLVFEDSGTVLRVLEGEVGPGVATSPDAATEGCRVDTGTADATWVDSGVLYYVALGLDPDGGCSSTPVPPTTPGATSGSGRTVRTIDKDETFASPTPTPTPTPTSTPRPSASPTPSATPEEPPSASAPDLWWLLWVIIGILLIVIVGGVVYFVRRT